MRLAGKHALVTGSSGGIGRAIVTRFRAEGARVTEADLDNGFDVADEPSVEQRFASLADLDVLVNNAGIQIEQPTHELSMASFDRVLAVNLRGAVLCARAALRHFLRRGHGLILTNTSVAQHIPKPGFLSYSMSKGALDNFTRSIALEYAPQGIRANNVGPGAVLTPMNDAWRHDPERTRLVESHIPLGYAAPPEQIAAVFAFLASDDARYITGQTIFVDGGLTLYPEFRENWAS